jgi:putative solute:sodium symporter small subunit
METYRKEARLTIGFFVLYLLAAHTAPWALIFGTNNGVRILGFPLHYFMAVFLGWFGVLAVSIWWNIAADRLDEEIAASGPAGPAMPASAPTTEGDRS